jgi:hypothetical protein
VATEGENSGMPLYDFTKSKACDLHNYRSQKKTDFVHRFSVAALYCTGNKAKLSSSP